MRHAAILAVVLLSACANEGPRDLAACLNNESIWTRYSVSGTQRMLVAGHDSASQVQCHFGPGTTASPTPLEMCRKAGEKDCTVLAINERVVFNTYDAISGDAVGIILGAAASGAALGYSQSQDDRLIAQRTAESVTAAQAAAPPRKMTCTPVWGSKQMTCK